MQDRGVGPPQWDLDPAGLVRVHITAGLRPGLIKDESAKLIPGAVNAVAAAIAAPGLEHYGLDDHVLGGWDPYYFIFAILDQIILTHFIAIQQQHRTQINN
jgi:hypothetical protein